MVSPFRWKKSALSGRQRKQEGDNRFQSLSLMKPCDIFFFGWACAVPSQIGLTKPSFVLPRGIIKTGITIRA
ncbi:hypothetical protein O9929_14470 [Vibrio lentus]|nr:hypothetical protein [Vibrio lentus]